MPRFLRPQGLITQLLVWVVIPILFILAFVIYGTVTLHEQAMRDLVGERDSRTVSAAAQALADRFTGRQVMLDLLVNRLADGISLAQALTDNPELKSVFDGGLVTVDPQGNRLDAWQQGSDWSTYLHYSLSPWVLDHATRKPLVIANAKSVNGRIILFSGISLESLNIPQAVGIWQKTAQNRFYIIADDTHIIQDSAGTDVGKMASSLPNLKPFFNSPVNQQTIFHDENQGLITVSSPVDKLNWTLVIQESWDDVASSNLRLSAIAPLAMIPALLLALSVLAFGIKWIVLPLQRLGQFSTRLAWGDYNLGQTPIGGLREIHELQTILVSLARRLQEAQAGMHSYIGATLQGQEDERKRLSRELHDDTLQALIALDQQRQMVQRALDRDSAKVVLHMAQLQITLGQAIDNLRRLIRDMRPSYLEDLGLIPTLETLSTQTEEATDIAITFVVHGVPQRLPSNYEVAVYRIAQEAVSNAVRYSHATHVSITLTFEQQITLIVQDDGKGFIVPKRPDSFAQNGHFGLMGMVERAEQIGANFRLDSTPQTGTRMEVTLTLSPAIQ